MSAREIRVSPDGEAIAIKSDKDPDGNEAWGVFHYKHGGAWVPFASVEDWTVLG